VVSLCLAIRGAADAIDFYRRAFGAVEKGRLVEPSGKIGHAEITIGRTTLMLSDEYPDFGAVSPVTLGGSPIRIHLAVPDVDGFVARSVAAGATILRPIADQDYGDRSALIADPFGFSWFVATPIKRVSFAEMQKQFTAGMSGG
jgi:PhnB protein